LRRKPAKVRFGYLATGEKVRISKASGTIIAKTMLPVYDPKVRNKNKIDGIKDTPASKVIFLFISYFSFESIFFVFFVYLGQYIN